MDNDDFDTALVSAALTLAQDRGWNSVTVLAAAREAGLPLPEARQRFPLKASILLRLGRMADDVALADDMLCGTARERLFDLLMRRLDVFQQYRDGLQSVLRSLPMDPVLTLLLGGATVESMRWMADAAGINTNGVSGFVHVNMLVAVWTHTLRVWEKDESPDMGSTMAALDQALDKAGRFGLFPTGADANTHQDGLADLDDVADMDASFTQATISAPRG
ncbi:MULTISPECIES: TetR family transcriptional regulator [Acetobacter]|uniref:AcrR family transcriptional regulator n=1 Tax=Acetobacter lovaniensis TaxID=104100 RepID=A0A841QHM5_9PROT|nr:TetR family transcriptional regulator [Acetobacter lovaniensis]MBB6457835.1 AcrR family transcriptional regulator [Acetobacter lovaniensis]MCI1698282.1 TetR family transcriptional regulator [Acetobacter lovaniensis]MCI1794911.1 TetR family transcriptional regulator [Acetobacter lovaniensis]MCP1240057.1 TetR family transcriptional regulator [Acetobacter lovaniensis]NHN82098.1 TetR family transcriptional regulator [Acetobacter lovaniensis]